MNMLNVFLQAAPASGGGSGIFGSPLLMMLLLIVVFYFFMIRPQSKRQKELKNFRNALQKGDKVVTTGGIYGKITNVGELTIEMEVAHDVVIKVDKFAILKDSSDIATQK